MDCWSLRDRVASRFDDFDLCFDGNAKRGRDELSETLGGSAVCTVVLNLGAHATRETGRDRKNPLLDLPVSKSEERWVVSDLSSRPAQPCEGRIAA